MVACLYQTMPVKQLYGKEWLYICRKHELLSQFIEIVNADYSKLYNSMFTSCLQDAACIKQKLHECTASYLQLNSVNSVVLCDNLLSHSICITT